MSHVAPPAAGQSLLRRLLTLEPAVVRGVIGALVLVLALWGVDAADLGSRVEQTVLTVLALVPLVTAWWTRSAVTPNAKVAEAVEADGTRVAGPASPLPTGATIPSPQQHTWDLGDDVDCDSTPWPAHDDREQA